MNIAALITGLKILSKIPSGDILSVLEDPSVSGALTLADDALPIIAAAGIVIPYVGEIEMGIAVVQFLAANSVPDPNPTADAQTAASSETHGRYVGR